MILMADSVSPYAIPGAFRAYSNRGVAPYSNGGYKWSAAAVSSFPRHLQGIDVNGQAPELADALDSERFDASPAEVPPWRARRAGIAGARRDHGQVPGWPKIYTSIAPGGGYGVAPIIDAIAAAGQERIRHWWIAWYIYPHIPTAIEVAAEIRGLTGRTVDAADIWGCQYASLGSYDLSVIYQPPEWV